ncbi:helicase-related protein [Terriglobus sp.]|uniref:helicase-related protein n=1 Tax=Terriglobus sp. TaxID=1889013 RepID=UPI003B000A82
MSLLPDTQWEIKYTPADGDLVRLFYTPALKAASRYDRSTGYFSATALTLAARGIEGLIRNDGHMRLIVGCTLKQPEVEAIERGEALRKTVEAHLGNMPLQPETPEAKDALELLAWMVAKGILEVKVAVPCGANRKPIASNGIFHEKAGIVEDKAGHRLAWNGSLNETVYGWQENWESINVFRSWDGEDKRVDAEDANFARIWSGNSPHLLTMDVPAALRDDLLRFMPESDEPARLQSVNRGERAIDGPFQEEGTTDPVETELSAEERRRLVWNFIRHAPALDEPGAERIGEATAAVQAWPHQAKAFQRMYRNWPPRLLIADEVGLGKTIQAGLLLRQAWLSGRAKRILILAPKAVLKQWQIELRNKFNLNWPIYDGQCLCWYPSPALRDHSERQVSPGEWHKEPIVLASSQLMRRRDRAEELLGAEDWDLVILDEAHHARRKSPGSPREHGVNSLLKLMRRLKSKAGGLILLTATPMQVHPVEVWDLLNLLGLPQAWTEGAFLSFHDRLSKAMPSHEDVEELAGMFRAMEQTYGAYSRDEIARRLNVSGLTAKRLLRILRDEATADRRALSSTDRQLILKLLRHTSPVGRLISRNTRELLRHYFKTGQMTASIANRDVEDVFLEMTPDERAAYDQVEEYIRNTYNQASPEQQSTVGFVMTIYRKRLASSFYALTQTLAKRRETLLQAEVSGSLFTEEDLPDDDIADDQGETEEMSELERAALILDDRSAVEDLLRQIEALPEDTKLQALRKVLAGLRDAGYRQTMVFTQFTDTLDFVRDELVRSTDLKILCFSGRGGEVPVGDGRWSKITRDDVRRRFARGEADILLCTDAAAEGLNFQFCGALVNYDLPWNPMRVEQRIGRIDRLGQRFPRIRIVNLHYEDTVESAVYKVLRERIKLFGDVVGKLQPILSQVAGQITRAILTTKAEVSADILVEDIERGAAQAEQATFDLDALLAADPPDGMHVQPLYDLGDLGGIINKHSVLIPEVRIDTRSDKEAFYQAAGMNAPARITVKPDYFDDHLEDVELWSPGNPLFPWEDHELSADTTLLNPFKGI